MKWPFFGRRRHSTRVQDGAPAGNRAVQGLWIGQRLTSMEQRCISSFLRHGHEFHLYAYGPVEGLPTGATLRDAAEILPESGVFSYRSGFGQGSFSAFSNFFRYKLLLERGGWWVDTDVVCVRPFDFQDESVLGTELLEPGSDRLVVSSSVIKQRAGSELMRWAWDECQRVSTEELLWGQVGPKLMQRGVDTLGLHVRGPTVFSPIPHFEWRRFVDPNPPPSFGAETYAVHLFHQMWRHEGVDPDGPVPETCLYARWRT